MRANPIDIFIFIVALLPLLKGFVIKFSSNSMKNSMREVGSNIAFIIAIICSIYTMRILNSTYDKYNLFDGIYEVIHQNFKFILENNPILIYAFVFPLLIIIIYKIVIFILEEISFLFFYPLIEKFGNVIKSKSEGFKALIGVLFQVPKAFCYVMLVSFALYYLSILNFLGGYTKYLEDSVSYNVLCKNVIIPISNSKFAKSLPNIINDSFKVEVKEINNSSDGKLGKKNVQYYYNGVTLEEGIKSNAEIDNFSRQLNVKEVNSRNKAKNIYSWIGKKIEYDEEKAMKILNNDFNVKSGAIPTYNTRKGICFDYACLYVAMCRANGLKVRIITGQGFNGVSWVSHAWNQVYIPEEGVWVNVDSTFYAGGNYFGTSRFDLDHKDAKIVGEW